MVDTIRRLCKEQGKTLFSLEQECGLGNGSINKWDRSSPSVAKVIAVANALGVSIADLIGGQEKMPTLVSEDGLSEAEQSMIKLFRLVPAEDQGMVTQMIEAALRSRGLL